MVRLVDMELASCADFCVTDNENGTYTVEFGSYMETMPADDLHAIAEHLNAIFPPAVGADAVRRSA